MPWCPHCLAYRAPSGVRRDGTCPACGTPVDPGGTAVPGDERLPPVPWHLKLLVAAVAAYLALRAWQGVDLLIEKLG